MLLFIICFLDNSLKRDNKGLYKGDKGGRLSEYYNENLVRKAKALKEVENELNFKEYS